MDFLLAAGIVFALVIVVNGTMRFLEGKRRAAGSKSPSGRPVSKEARSVPTRLFVEKSIPGGPRSGGINRSPADVVLTDLDLVVSTGRGRVMLINKARVGTAVSTGPERLVLEGLHPTKDVKVRAELLVSDTQAWVDGVRAIVGAG